MPKYRNASLPLKERVRSLMNEMTVEEKIAQINCILTLDCVVPDVKRETPHGVGEVGLVCPRENDAGSIAEFVCKIQDYYTKETRLGIPAIVHIEALTGAQFRDSVIFPASIGLAATWNPDNVKTMASIASRQLYSLGIRQALSPVVDVIRDLRWGRVAETYGEDPSLCAAMGVAYVEGLQGKGFEKRVSATAKHFLGYSASDCGLNMGNCSINERDMLEIFAKPFQAMITEAGVGAIMNSYAAINRVPVASSHRLLTELLREQMGFDGPVVADYISVDRLADCFHTAEDYPDAGAQALRAGIDVEVPNILCYTKEMLEQKGLDISVLDTAVERVLSLKMRLGLFENPYPDHAPDFTGFRTPADFDAAEKAARESLVLVKNENHTLPLKKNIGTIAIIGPHIGDVRTLFGEYTYPAMLEMGFMDDVGRVEDYTVVYKQNELDSRIYQKGPGIIEKTSESLQHKLRELYKGIRSIDEAIEAKNPYSRIIKAVGCPLSDRDDSQITQAEAAAKEADVVILLLGGKGGWGVAATTGEGTDNAHIGLPGIQEKMAIAVLECGKPTVVVHTGARPMCCASVAQRAAAVLEVWTPGVRGAEVVADVVFGDAAPMGKLPLTAPRNEGQLPCLYNQQRGTGYMGAGKNGAMDNAYGYIDDTAEPLWCFGHGLSYTEYQYSDFSVSCDGMRINAAVKVKNTGKVSGAEIAQLYVCDPVASVVRPNKELVGFCRVELEPGEEKQVDFDFPVSQLAFLNDKMEWVVERGEYLFNIAASAHDVRQTDRVFIGRDINVDEVKRGFYCIGKII